MHKKKLGKLKLEKLNNRKELKEIETELKSLKIELIKERFSGKLEIEIEIEIKTDKIE